MKYIKTFEFFEDDYYYCYPVNIDDILKTVNIFRFKVGDFKLIKCYGKKFDKMKHEDAEYFICYNGYINRFYKMRSYLILKTEVNNFGGEIKDIETHVQNIKYNI